VYAPQGTQIRIRKKRHPLAPVLSSAKTPLASLSCQIDRLKSPTLPAFGRCTRPGSRFAWLSCICRARTSHPSGSRPSGRSARNPSRPLALSSPRKPSVPDRVQSADRHLKHCDGHTETWLAAAWTAPLLFWLTTEAYPPAKPAPRSALPCPSLSCQRRSESAEISPV